MRRRGVLLVGVAIVATAGLSARAALRSRQSTVLRIGLPAPLEPQGITEGNGFLSLVSHLVYRPAVHPDGTGTFQPYLAESLRWDATGRTLTVRLRDARFEDGSPIGATDLVDAIRRFPATDVYGDARDSIDAMRPVDERTLEIHVLRPSPYLMDLLEVPLWKESGGARIESGPYAIASSDERRFALRRLHGQGYDRMEFLPFATTDELWKRLLAREIDVAPLLSVAGYEALARYPWVRRLRSPTGRAWVLRWAPDARHGVEVRRALALAIDRAHLERLAAPAFEAMGWKSPPEDIPTPDPDAARALLGFVPGGPAKAKLVVGYPASVSEIVQVMAILEADLARVGIELAARPLPASECGATYHGEDLHVTLDRITTTPAPRPPLEQEMTLGRLVELSAAVDTVCGLEAGTGGPLRHAEKIHPCAGAPGE